MSRCTHSNFVRQIYNNEDYKTEYQSSERKLSVALLKVKLPSFSYMLNKALAMPIRPINSKRSQPFIYIYTSTAGAKTNLNQCRMIVLPPNDYEFGRYEENAAKRDGRVTSYEKITPVFFVNRSFTIEPDRNYYLGEFNLSQEGDYLITFNEKDKKECEDYFKVIANTSMPIFINASYKEYFGPNKYLKKNIE
ncbi:hypothetical protein EHO60_09000 [Leptospira fletcheri]|uniref:Uncharacterized protein n=1 Tax=Leptospira fletcheri TaxID=2484981 RepID=A0A4R9GI61_9LEPT|nr:hypothetical protein [Leptospira fletcheri]TGK12377.1 hypothetical protein EHO60_09000 [Leptospira fletcheri]